MGGRKGVDIKVLVLLYFDLEEGFNFNIVLLVDRLRFIVESILGGVRILV